MLEEPKAHLVVRTQQWIRGMSAKVRKQKDVVQFKNPVYYSEEGYFESHPIYRRYQARTVHRMMNKCSYETWEESMLLEHAREHHSLHDLTESLLGIRDTIRYKWLTRLKGPIAHIPLSEYDGLWIGRSSYVYKIRARLLQFPNTRMRSHQKSVKSWQGCPA